jgi:hypothetical protein
MKNAPGISWGPESPYNLVRICDDERGSGYALLDCSSPLYTVVRKFFDQTHGNKFVAHGFAMDWGRLMNGGGSGGLSSGMRAELDATP